MFFKRFFPLTLIITITLMAYTGGAHHYFTIANLKELHQTTQIYVQEHALWAPIVFMLICYLYSALAIPGGFVLTILAGVLFPLPLSTLYVLVADTLGCCTLFLSAKAAFGQNLPKKIGPVFVKMEKGFHRNPISYLLFMRFIPIFPFWITNTVPAFFGISLSTFFWTTVVGLIPENLILTAGASLLMDYLTT